MKKILLAGIILLQFFVVNSYGQFRMKLGPQIGLNFNLHNGSDLKESGSGFGFVFGGQVDMNFSSNIGLITNLQFYDNRSGSNEEESSNQYQDNQGNPVTSTVTDEQDISLAYFLIEPLFKLSIPQSGFYFFAGPSLGFNVEGSFERTVTETLPDPYTFNDGSNKSTAKSKGSIKDLLARVELKLGSGMDIPIGTGMYISPQLSFGYGITKVQEDVSWRVMTAQALVAFKFSLIR